ncbi:DUF1877 family protein [Thermomonospora amylolytica]|uniref:DUF1877 family protein n=1 Tax=Thermomonospora amylolytica TaxID=1411117 RepID=UPI000E6D2240|nr:DUF1877 family protein [Thermomonospora amylolytica]
MGVLGSYVRLPFDDWLAVDEAAPEEADALLDAVYEHRRERWLDVDKTWDALDMLLVLATGGETGIAGGARAMTPYRGGETSFLDAGDVRRVAGALARTPFDRLVAAYDPEVMAAAYPPGVWTDRASLEPLEGTYARVRDFFRAAAADLDFVLIVIG